jgi:hypothetical protein
VPLLSREQYLATMGDHPGRVNEAATPPGDFWRYVDQIPAADLGGYDFSQSDVSHAWNTVEGKWQHVLIGCTEPNVFLVVVLDLAPPGVSGHYLLNLNVEYGTKDR